MAAMFKLSDAEWELPAKDLSEPLNGEGKPPRDARWWARWPSWVGSIGSNRRSG